MSIYTTKRILVLISILFILVACTATSTEIETVPTALPTAPQAGKVIVLGDISDDPGEVIEGAQPLADYLATHLSDFGVTKGQVKVAASADEMAEMLKNGEVDLYFDSVYPATLISDISDAQPFLRRWKYGVEEYHTVIFASIESGVTSLDDLPGHMIAFDTPYSTSGFVLPSMTLIQDGLSLVGKESYNDPVGDDEVGFVFSYDDENTLQWVLSGFVSAGATDDYHYEVLFPPEVLENLVLLAETESVPRQVAVARDGLDPELFEAIKQLLMNMHQNEEGQAALDSFQTSRFDEFPEGIDAALERMREMMETVQSIPTS